jgi:hypothetical protein
MHTRHCRHATHRPHSVKADLLGAGAAGLRGVVALQAEDGRLGWGCRQAAASARHAGQRLPDVRLRSGQDDAS